jgi:hypothetical protein
MMINFTKDEILLIARDFRQNMNDYKVFDDQRINLEAKLTKIEKDITEGRHGWDKD